MKQLFCIISYFFQLHLMLHACIRKSNVTSTVDNVGLRQEREEDLFGNSNK